MIRLTRMQNRPFVLNSDLIETVEETPDTVITMTTGHKYLVEESAETVIHRIITFRARCYNLSGYNFSGGNPELLSQSHPDCRGYLSDYHQIRIMQRRPSLIGFLLYH